MKKALSLCCLLIMLAGLSANPVIARAVERVWFNAEGDFFVRFDEEAQGWSYIEQLPGFAFSTSSGMWTWPVGFVAPTALPWQCNLSQTIPGFTIDPLNDIFSCHLSEYFSERIQWGSGCDLYTEIHPLGAGQSAVQVRVQEWDYAGVNTWAKDIGLSYQGSPFHPAHNCSISVQVKDQQGNAVAGIPVDYTYTFNSPWHGNNDYTSDEGVWDKDIYAARIWLRVVDPTSQFAVLDTLLYPEPDSTYSFEAVVTSVATSDHVQTPAQQNLHIFPNVLNSSPNILSIKYDAILPPHTELRLYDLRGRLLRSKEMPASRETEWNVSDLRSGVYFVALFSNDKQLARQRLTIIK